MRARLEEVKSAVITKIKSSDIPLKLVDVKGNLHPEEVREFEWRGSKFYYPNIRVRVQSLKPRTTDVNCSESRAVIHIVVFGENYSSKLIDEIASDILDLFHGYSGRVEDIRLSSIECEHIGADFRGEVGVWAAEIKCNINSVVKVSS